MVDAEDHGTLPDEWEGKIIGEEADGYLVAWESSFIPKKYAGEAMIRTWEEMKAKILAGGGKKGRGTGLKQPATIKCRVERRGIGKMGRGFLRSKLQPKRSGHSKRESATGNAFTPEANRFLIELKEQHRLEWREIHKRFMSSFPSPERSVGSLQVHYYTKLMIRVMEG